MNFTNEDIRRFIKWQKTGLIQQDLTFRDSIRLGWILEAGSKILVQRANDPNVNDHEFAYSVFLPAIARKFNLLKDMFDFKSFVESFFNLTFDYDLWIKNFKEFETQVQQLDYEFWLKNPQRFNLESNWIDQNIQCINSITAILD